MYFKITFDLDIFIIYQDIGIGHRSRKKETKE